MSKKDRKSNGTLGNSNIYGKGEIIKTTEIELVTHTYAERERKFEDNAYRHKRRSISKG